MKTHITVPALLLVTSLCISTVLNSDMTSHMANNEALNNRLVQNSMVYKTTINASFSMPLLTHDEKCVTITVSGANANITQLGEPVLPMYQRTVTFPFGTQITDITCAIGNITRMQLQGTITTNPFPKNLDNGSTYEIKNHEDDRYPESWYSYKVGSGLNGTDHVVFLSLQMYPVGYLMTHSEVEFTSSISMCICYKLPDHELVANDEFDLLIITPVDFADALQPLTEHKEKYGIATRLVTLEDIQEGIYFLVNGRDLPEIIKYFIKNAAESWGINYVLIVGDIAHIPSRQVFSFAWGENTLYSDHYYADLYDAQGIFCSWDSNNNNQFGETYEDNNDLVDLYADVYVGRLACNNLEEVNTVVHKIVTYETTAYASEWFNRLILMGGDTFPGWGNVEGELVNEYVANAMPEFEHVKLQTSLHTFMPNKITQEWSSGAGFICFSGHGFEYGFGTHPEDDNRWITYYTPYLLWLKNENRLPIVFFDACLTSKLDYYMLGNTNVPNFAWCLVKKSSGGAIATIGATESAVTSVDSEGIHGAAGYMDLHFFMAYKPGVTVAEMLVNAQNDYLNDCAVGIADDSLLAMTIEQFILLGDPTLKTGGYP